MTHVNHLTRFAAFSAAVKVEEPAQTPVKVIKLTIGQQAATVDGSPYTLDAVPFVDTKANRKGQSMAAGQPDQDGHAVAG
ncbi:MAG: hypothetical protein QHH75_03330 [Bacillota bacterium]|nr:hypothetical protein [Bacillota bacterium]